MPVIRAGSPTTCGRCWRSASRAWPWAMKTSTTIRPYVRIPSSPCWPISARSRATPGQCPDAHQLHDRTRGLGLCPPADRHPPDPGSRRGRPQAALGFSARLRRRPLVARRTGVGGLAPDSALGGARKSTSRFCGSTRSSARLGCRRSVPSGPSSRKTRAPRATSASSAAAGWATNPPAIGWATCGAVAKRGQRRRHVARRPVFACLMKFQHNEHGRHGRPCFFGGGV
jgi:hypothetical protein